MMTSKKSEALGTSLQSTKFKAMAKELEADDDPKAFDAKLKALAKAQEKPAK